RFRRWPAAVRHHGAVVGGLLEHTVNVTTIAELTARLYPCDHDLVLAGALLHDIGKLEELEGQVGAGFTPHGRMVGHIVLGMYYVQEQAQQVAALEEGKMDDLLHIILAHHTKEYGSPVNPATIEALIVHQADLAEAHLTGFLEHCQKSCSSNGWTSFSPIYGGQLRVS
ncbi:MAG: HD domain-containing protein, partial [Chloroflexi bacterium]